MRTTALVGASLFLLLDLASVAEAQRRGRRGNRDRVRLVIRDFEGPRASRVRSQAVRAFARRRQEVRLVRSRELSRAERNLGLDLELSADMIVAADLGVSGEMDGNSQSAELSVEMSGTYEYTVETEE